MFTSLIATPTLTVENVSAGYAGARNAIEHVSFDVYQGERVAVLGPNGAGKSTLFKAIVGLLPFDSGSISIHGQDCHASHNLVGYVPQHNEIDWNFPVTVRDVVMMGQVRQIGWFRFPGRQHSQAVDKALERVGMLQFRDRQIGELSGGQKRRVFIARALAQKTDVLLLDEPFSGVDVSAEQEIMHTLDLLQAAQVTVIVATHDLGLASSRFDKLLLLKQHVIAYGTSDDVFTPETLKATYGGRVGFFGHGSSEEAFFILDEHGCSHGQ